MKFIDIKRADKQKIKKDKAEVAEEKRDQNQERYAKKTMMSKLPMDKKKKILIIASAAMAGLLIVAFVLFKIFVTPKVIVGLALKNATEDLNQSVEFFTNSDEKEVIQRIMKKGGKTEMNIIVSKSAFLEGTKASVVCNGDGKATVTEIKLYSVVPITTYKDDEHILINTPIPGGNFEVTFNNMEGAISNSIFKEKIVSSPETMAASSVLAFVSGGFNIKDFYNRNINEFKDIALDIEIEKNGTSNVLIGSETEKADVYIAHIKSDDMDRIISIIKEYCKELGIEEKHIENALKGMRTDCDIEFKIIDYKIYEICIFTSDNKTHTIAFTGKENMFDNITYYENDNTDNAIRRVHDQRGNTITEKITVGDTTWLDVEKTTDKLEIRIGSGDKTFILNASGKKVGEDYIAYSEIEFGLEEKFLISATDVKFSEKFDKVSFAKAKNYKNLFEVSEEEWKVVFEFLKNAVTFVEQLKGFKLF